MVLFIVDIHMSSYFASYITFGMHAYVVVTVDYRISGFFPKVLIFPNFPNELLTPEILFWIAD